MYGGPEGQTNHSTQKNMLKVTKNYLKMQKTIKSNTVFQKLKQNKKKNNLKKDKKKVEKGTSLWDIADG